MDITGQTQKSIAIVANATWNIYNFRMNILAKLTEQKFKIYVIAPIDQYMHYKESFPDLTHIPLKNLSRKSTNPFKDFLLLVELFRIYRKIKPDILLHYTVKPNIYGGIAAGILRTPSIAVVTGLGYAFIHTGIVKEITILLYRFSSRFHRKMIFENQDDLKLFESLKMIKKGKGISIKGCGVDTNYFKPKSRSTFPEKIIFTFIGRLIYDKGIKEFVEAAKNIKEKNEDIQFWVLGEIDKNNPAAIKETDLVRWIQDKTIVYHGSKDNIRKYIGNSDCIVLPSYREGLPKTLLESMAMSKPIITTDSPGCREAVQDGYNGLLVPVKNIPELVYAIERMYKMPREEMVKMGKNGRKKAITEFEASLIAEQMSQYINKLIE